MKKTKTIMALALAGIMAAAMAQTTLNGAGASFPAPVYQHWTYTYGKSNPQVKVNYQSLGSGAGINQIRSKTIDFAGTDNPLTKEEQEKNQLVQFPMLTGGVVVIVNIPGIKTNLLQLDRKSVADIFLGNITSWDDPAIKALNPNLKLPKLKITVVRRADASGTSFIFTNYLTKISKEWADRVGYGSSVNWPVGIGAQKNPGVCINVSKVKGSIGYTEYAYAVEAKITTVKLENATGKFVAPTTGSFTASAANADWNNTPGLYMILTDQPGDESWPITGVTYILIRRDCSTETRQALIQYFNWCFTNGVTAAKKLNYVPIPENVVKLIQENVFK